MNLVSQLRHFFKVGMWQDFSEEARPIYRLAINSLRVVYVLIHEFIQGDLNLRAMSLVFTTLLSIVPLIAVAFSVLKGFGIHNQLEPLLLQLFQPLGEEASTITNNIVGFVENIKVGVLGSVGLAMLFYTIIGLVQKVEEAFNFVWRVKQSRTLMRRVTDYLSVLMIGPVLIFAALGLATAAMDNGLIVELKQIEPFGSLIVLATKLMPYVMISLAFTFLYKFIPNTKVQLLPAFIGAAVAGALWISIGTGFAFFVSKSSSYTAVYSGFAILFFFMIWLYLAWIILLVGSQVAFYLQHPKLAQLAGKPLILSARQKEREGLWLMVMIARGFHQHKLPFTLAELEQKMGLPAISIQELITLFERAGLLVEVGDKLQYLPAQDIATIKVIDIMNILRTAEESLLFVPVTSQADQKLCNLLDRSESALVGVFDDLTLSELAIEPK